MQFDYKSLRDLTKRAAAWQKGLSLAGANAEQRSYGLLQADSDGDGDGASSALSFTVRGPYGWLSESLDATGANAGTTGFEIGADPASLMQRISEIYGRDSLDLSVELQGKGEQARAHRVVIEAEDYRRKMPLDPLTGFSPEALVPLPEVDPEQATHSVTLQVSQLQQVLQFALHAAPASETQPTRAVVTLEFEDDEVRGLATDGRLIMRVAGSVTTPAEDPWRFHISTEAGSRLYGLLSTVPDQSQVTLDVCPSSTGTTDPEDPTGAAPMLLVSFEAVPITAVLPLPIAEGLPVEQIFSGLETREPMATITVAPRTVHDLQAVGMERAIVVETTAHGMRVWARIDTDEADDERLAAADVPASDCAPGRLAVDSSALAKLIALLSGDTLSLQSAKAARGSSLLLIEQISEAEVSVLAGLVGLQIGQ